ncbi:MAG TPA: MarR family winged helix-turn-helix transcriptional regulator [Actinomycetes bacterium]|jgi:DNA-binding MarR family transcriptional regulator|nr:MarR family winged helix-turn-helix transcriptional regulator [Actinomycetes bacterium]
MDEATAPGSMVLLMRLTRVLHRRSTEKVLGMRVKEYVALVNLRDHDHEGMPQQELGEQLGMDANNLVLLLNELEADGLAERRRDPADRRRHIVQVLPAGRRALERAERGMERVEDEVLAALSPEERATLRRLLVRALEGQPAAR